MSGERQLSIWTALGLWAAAVASAAVYGAWHGYSGRAYAVTLCVLAFFLAIQLSFAAGNLGERFARRAGSHRGVLIATVPFLAYLIYLAGTNSFTWWRAAFAAAYTSNARPAHDFRRHGETRRVAGLPCDAGDFSPA